MSVVVEVGGKGNINDATTIWESRFRAQAYRVSTLSFDIHFRRIILNTISM